MNTLADHTIETLGLQLAAWGCKPVHSRTILRAFYESGGEVDWESLTLPRELRLRAPLEMPLTPAEVVTRQVSADGTTKLLMRMGDGRAVESVLMPGDRPDRAAGCLSSQVGCAMGCDFCATAQGGFERNLTAGEMVAQFLALRREALLLGRRLQTVVFMGMGEPLRNLEAVLEAARRMADNRLGGLGWRQITVSTVGIVPGIDALTETGLNLGLAISLHAPDDATRAQILPTGRRYSIAEILAAVERYQLKRGHPVTIQYCLLAGVNDSLEQARELAEVVGSRRMRVNLLRYNPTGPGLSGRDYGTTSVEATAAFQAELRARGVVVQERRARGPDIDAACGQLRRRGERLVR
jgi:23S rRNA (adenine2503-C2)-methyltransferase